MTRKQAKVELNKILNQKTVSISRLKKVLAVLDYEKLERQYINAGNTIRKQGYRIHKLKKGMINNG